MSFQRQVFTDKPCVHFLLFLCFNLCVTTLMNHVGKLLTDIKSILTSLISIDELLRLLSILFLFSIGLMPHTLLFVFQSPQTVARLQSPVSKHAGKQHPFLRKQHLERQ